MERFFQLALSSSPGKPAGWVGQITSNSFMKRDSGRKLIEEFLPRLDLVAVVDSEGAWIPGHNSDGTPTVIIFARNQLPTSVNVRAVLSKGLRESKETSDGTGPYWRSIVEHIGGLDLDNEWVTVTDIPRSGLIKHPWSLSGGGANDLVVAIERRATSRLSEEADTIGIVAFTLEDEAYIAPTSSRRFVGVPSGQLRPMVLGDNLRDYSYTHKADVAFPYSSNYSPLDPSEKSNEGLLRAMWPYRTNLSSSIMFGRTTKVDSGLKWTEYGRLSHSKLKSPMSITFAFVATHNHFVLDRGGKIFNRSAPVIKMPASASEEDHLFLLAALNSSTACFWLKEKSQPKGGASGLFWSRTYEFTGATLEGFPLPGAHLGKRGQQIDSFAQKLASVTPYAIIDGEVPTATALKRAQEIYQSTIASMIGVQEEIDWEVYSAFGLSTEDLSSHQDCVPAINLGERAFELALARKPSLSREEHQWFVKHRSTPITTLPEEWPAAYRDLVQKRLDAIESNPNIRLLEKPEYKRRWATEPWEKQEERALRTWLLNRLEDRSYWFDAQGRPAARSISQLADMVTRDTDLVGVLSLWDGTVDVDVVKALTRLLTDEAVPYLVAQRLKEPGLRKREAWEETWELQRREDNGEDVGKIPVPPKYTNTDFRKASWWQARGKLDVPKERFILYSGAGRSTDPTLLLGWAGWDHVQQFLALATIMDERRSEGADDAQLVPLVAGMAEVLPWVKQWHAALDPSFGMSMADFCTGQLEERMTQLNLTAADLKAWRPATAPRGRRTLKENA